MTVAAPRKGIPYGIVAIALVACSMLIYEILLTRICSLRVVFHFGYLVVSNCLLGIGASGTMIMLMQDKWKDSVRQKVFLFSVLYLVSLIVTYIFLLKFPIPSNFFFYKPGSLAIFAVFTMGSAVPFFFGGAVIGLLLTFNAEKVNTYYGADLVGAGLACFAMPFILAGFGAGGCIVVACLLVIGAIVSSAPEKMGNTRYIAGGIAAVVALGLLPVVDDAFPVPGKGRLSITAAKALNLDIPFEYSEWSATSRVDMVPMLESSRFLFGTGPKRMGEKLPETKYITQDGTAGTYYFNFSDNPEALQQVANTLYSATLRLKDKPKVFIIGAGGGNDMWAASLRDPEYMRAIELNKQTIKIHKEVLPEFARNLWSNPNYELVYGEGRVELAREKRKYDVIQMSAIDTWSSLASGAYVLAENYLYTREAIEDMLAALDDDGMIQILRYAKEMEVLRLLSNTEAAFQEMGLDNFEKSVAVIYTTTVPFAALTIKPGGFTEEELASMHQFIDDNGFSIYYMPDRSNRDPIDNFVRAKDKEAFIKNFPRNIEPNTDDIPYFFNFTKWQNIFSSADYIEENHQVSQGNPLFLIGQLLFVTLISFTLIVLPLLIFKKRGFDRTHAGKFLLYFIGLGVGFIVIEIAIMQKFILFLGHPMYSLTVTLFSILIFSGIGAFISGRWFNAPGPHSFIIPSLIALLVMIFYLAAGPVLHSLITLPLVARLLVATLLLAPFGLVLGMPFAYGVHLVDRFNPSFVPWAWAVNGCFTVIGSVLTVILSMNFGFNITMVMAVLIYFMSFIAISGLWRGNAQASA